ncbi:hypothetical protein L1987_24114 [Smallanthus sonchifolius]|uniref:Uncharacterized protein n=1 Tax=Smallanthus sonchifolius TaxID=185202 RepID=A0ACB9IKF3_9ASTR|nr:hypothetical protein L1987_24114 [Smallanthus sonchifolius]
MYLSSKSASMAGRVGKRTKVIWTKDLHNKFLEAIRKLGIDNAVPKKILELMKVDGLTRDHVASHLQKYRILSKKIANANYCVQTASKPCLLESSMTNVTSWSYSSLMLNQEQMNWPSYSTMHANIPPILDTSRSYIPFVEASNINATISSHWGSLPNKGYSMQAMTNNLDEQRNFIDYTTNLGVVNLVNSSNTGFVQNLDGLFGGGSTEVQVYNNFEMDSSGFVQNPNGFESKYFSQSEFAEIGSLYGSLYGAGSNSNLENGIGEDDIILNEVDIAYLLSYADESKLSVNLDTSNQDVNWQNVPDNVSFYSNHNEEFTSINQHQTSDGYLPGFNPTFKHMDEQYTEPIWSPVPVAEDITFQGLILNSYVHA